MTLIQTNTMNHYLQTLGGGMLHSADPEIFSHSNILCSSGSGSLGRLRPLPSFLLQENTKVILGWMGGLIPAASPESASVP